MTTKAQDAVIAFTIATSLLLGFLLLLIAGQVTPTISLIRNGTILWNKRAYFGGIEWSLATLAAAREYQRLLYKSRRRGVQTLTLIAGVIKEVIGITTFSAQIAVDADIEIVAVGRIGHHVAMLVEADNWIWRHWMMLGYIIIILR